jgi:hypothetical protein
MPSDETDISPYVVHFTKAGGTIPPLDPEDDEASALSSVVRRWPGINAASAFDRFMAVIADRWVRASSATFGAAKDETRLGDTQRAVCFSEIPLGQLGRLVERRSPYGIGFSKRTIRYRGGARVWYLDHDDGPAKALRDLLRASRNEFDEFDELWKLTPFMDQPRSYPYRDQWEWEREWRVPGPQGVSFETHEVEFLFLPEDFHGEARAALDDAVKAGDLPKYNCPLVDPRWDSECVNDALRSHGGE